VTLTSLENAATKATKRRRVNSAASGAAAAQLPPPPLPKLTTRGQQIKVLKKFK
jgi:hypothetical protein